MEGRQQRQMATSVRDISSRCCVLLHLSALAYDRVVAIRVFIIAHRIQPLLFALRGGRHVHAVGVNSSTRFAKATDVAL